MLGFYVGTGDPNPGPQACTAGTLATELFPKHKEILSKVIFISYMTV